MANRQRVVRPRVLALDLEGTLITDASSRIPRPELGRFLDFCLSRFERVVLYTYVPRNRATDILGELILRGVVPEAARRIGYVDWDFGQFKDLGAIADAPIDEAILIDDQVEFVHPEQLDHWIGVPSFEAPGDPRDRALEDVQEALDDRVCAANTRIGRCSA